MDDIVRQAMAKWPNVPHCYGWLALDARGNWRMRDEAAQRQNAPGERIANTTLQSFIHRNYTHDDAGRWYFQNGPQRVYIDLEVAPYVARTDPTQGFVLHTGQALSSPDAAWLTLSGRLLLRAQDKLAALDDRDLAAITPDFQLDGAALGDEQLLEWLADQAPRPLEWQIGERRLAVERIPDTGLDARFGFVSRPREGS
ncbi:DUF2946 family protein [Noviherbaspirillum pedocola]|uniref:DUF2946 family protein n=1 Tax=Noviherbaspirillum pedocola TaxID=2801341 RepID=A0A934SMJ1_9BURK|nr:DUF2946 family protein [Noviherbaspirillum pedocola]MBK4733321.1 DUF2946 family protein [Noviherbaspirillum pedocola]